MDIDAIMSVLQGDYSPRPADLRNVTLTRGMMEMAERVAENAHETWARKKKEQLDSIGGCHVICGRTVAFYSDQESNR